MTEPWKLHRSEGPSTSEEAAYSIDAAGLEKIVLEAIKSFGPDGCISDDVQDYLEARNLCYSSVTARYSALENKGMMFRNGDKRVARSNRRMLVMRAAEYEKTIPHDELEEIEAML